jgi:C4-dicarboxylate transporter, DctQ subunit
MFVWFVFFGASYAARLSAHNRVTVQFKPFPKMVAVISETIADLFWVIFNLYFIWLSIDFVFFKMNLFWKSQTLGVPMKYIYMILPIVFTLMTIRVIQVNYLRLVKGIDIRDPDQLEVEAMIEEARSPSSHR